MSDETQNNRNSGQPAVALASESAVASDTPPKSEGYWPNLEELIRTPAIRPPKDVLQESAREFNETTKGVLTATIFTELPRGNREEIRHFFYLNSSISEEGKVELLHLDQPRNLEENANRYPVTIYYPDKTHNGQTLYEDGIVQLDEGNIVADTLEEALKAIFASNYTRGIIRDLYQRSLLMQSRYKSN